VFRYVGILYSWNVFLKTKWWTFYIHWYRAVFRIETEEYLAYTFFKVTSLARGVARSLEKENIKSLSIYSGFTKHK
jgi:hypothetical protein